MKLAITGTHAVGKTTLAKALGKEFGMAVVPEFARELLEATSPAKGTDVTKKWVDKSNMDWLQFQSVMLNVHNSVPATGFIKDRTGLDILAYLIVSGGRRKLIGIEQIIFSLLIECVQNIINENEYDCVIYVPAHLLPSNETTKELNILREEVDAFIAMNLHHLQANKIITLNSLAITEVLDELNRIGISDDSII